ncbi:MAG: ornithine carbamoyltransferase [Candidatus Eremiobacterota bacterium]
MKTLLGRHFLSFDEVNYDDIVGLFRTAQHLKTQSRCRQYPRLLAGRTLGMIFEQTSTRTRVSFEVGMLQLGGHALFLSANDLKLAKGEPLSDTSRVLSRYLDVLMARIFSQANLEEIARYASIPVINAMTDMYHPCQALADVFTVWEKRERLQGLKLAYVGDGNNVCHTTLLSAAKVGMNVYSAHPEGHLPDPAVVERARGYAREWGAEVRVGHDARDAFQDADVIYTDVWLSPGQTGSMEERIEKFRPYQVNREAMRLAHPRCLFLHCLPAKRELEVTEEVFEGPNSVVFDEAENRMHAQKALLVHLVP